MVEASTSFEESSVTTDTQTAAQTGSQTDSQRRIDNDLDALAKHKDEWARLPVASKIEHLRTLASNTSAQAERWVAAACDAKGLDRTSPLAGEEWTSGPWALLFGINRLIETLTAIETTGTPRLRPKSVHTRRDGQVVVDVFPQSGWDRLLLSGISAEVWMQPGVTRDNLADTMAVFYKQRSPHGAVALVLGAGNIASIPPLDVLYKMVAEGRVCLLKMNPVNEYLGPVFEDVFADLVAAGFLRVAYGGSDVGDYLANHRGVDEIHITGSNRTHDAIVFGAGKEGAARKRRGEPVNTKRMTSELGNVSPTIVVPGPWSERDLRFQAAHIATQKLHNAGFNCIASQVLITARRWSLTEPLLAEVASVMSRAPRRPAYYPGAAQRQRALAQAHPAARMLGGDDASPTTLITDVDSTDGTEMCFRDEAFAGVLTATSLPARSMDEYLDRAVDFCNDSLWGTLGANIIIHPATARRHAEALDRAIARLRYGCIGVNAWTGVGFLLAQASWGAFPGHTADDIQSGIGVVHNSLLFDRPQKSVVRAPFHPYPRSLAHGQPTLLPTPPWFVTHRHAHQVNERLTRFEADHAVARVPGIFLAALRS
ncbi:MAG: aldehyde dehydrogenase family protein [Candidatus Dormibacteraeota bacterium]|uniref:Aldehyde dehydrogenase family protein n=1 Tax=Candidatus Amunia macphersoniae TaxID=3127014 RepID=A0A934KHU8_9BACT|nr:aldehyde dehydrogenase family protein [Candidatus Dormibacteraeota bacterium]